MLECSIYTITFAIFGMFLIFLFLLDTLWNLIQASRALLAPYLIPNEETSLAKKFGTWALVTGGTDGIGKAYAFELARRSINIILASRNEEKLLKISKEIETLHFVKTKIIVVDFSDGEKAINIVKEHLTDISIGILVNNVGKQYEYPMYLNEVPEKDLWDIITINVGAVTLLCRAFIEDMAKKHCGAIVNVSSGSELQPLPLMTVYAATKAYVKSFTAALRYEYAHTGITIQHLSPMFINTKMNNFSSKLRETSTFIPDAETYAKFAVNTLGKIDQTTGYWAHGIQYFLTSIAPVWIRMQIGGYLNKAFRRDFLLNSKQQEIQ